MLSHTLSLSLSGLSSEDAATPTPRALIELAARLGYRAVQLDAAAAGMRPRDLDRSARRDLAGLLRRLELRLSGLDLWIPREHFSDPGHMDRAMAAVASAVELGADLSRLVASDGAVVSVTLPDGAPRGVHDALTIAGDRVGGAIADHAWPVNAVAGGPLGIGVDPAVVMSAGEDAAKVVTQLPMSPASARLSDLGAGGRVLAGEGRLDLLAYGVALSTKGYTRPLVVDLRDVRDPSKAAERMLKA